MYAGNIPNGKKDTADAVSLLYLRCFRIPAAGRQGFCSFVEVMNRPQLRDHFTRVKVAPSKIRVSPSRE